MKVRSPLLPLAAAAFLLSSCSDGSSAPPTPVLLVLTPETVTMDALGLTQQFSAQLQDRKGRPVTGAAITWSSSSPEIATVSYSGLATGLRRGTARIRATAEGLTAFGTLVIEPVPATLTKVAGDGQTGPLNEPLAEELALEVLDSQGHPLTGLEVGFTVLAGEGSVSPGAATTDLQGRVSTTWTLGCSDADPQRLGVSAGPLATEFTAAADLGLPAICQESVPDGRATFAYLTRLEAVGGNPEGRVWEVESGDLPAGVSLSPEGILEGVPEEAGTFPFRPRIRDGSGNVAARDLNLRVCEAPVALAPGERASLPPSGGDGCGLFLPAGEPGDRYRIAALWATADPSDTSNLPLVTVSVQRVEALGIPSQPAPSWVPESPLSSWDWRVGLPAHFVEALEAEAATEAFHLRLREAERELLRRLGPGVRLLPDSRTAQRVSPSPEPAPEKLRLIPNNGSKCDQTSEATALKVAENDFVVLYQDSLQSTIDSLTITTAHAELMLDYYRDFGKPVIDTYFGGVTDINNDGRVVVFVTPVVESAVAYVWSGDFLAAEDCEASNQMELVRFRASSIRGLLNGGYQPLGTLVHEIKHLTSLYQGIGRWRASGGAYAFHPGWVEEGTATMAGEISSRLAWAANGGPAVGAMVRGADKVLTPETYYMYISWGRGMFYLSSQPNGLVGVPQGASSRHSVYGSGWHFHRWLGDAYGGAAEAMADGALFSLQNDSLTAPGATGIWEITGTVWEELLDEYATAILLNGTGAPRPERAFTSYDLPEVTRGIYGEGTQPPGSYPWPVNVTGDLESAPFQSAVSIGTVGPSGIRVFDLTSDGSGLGVEIEVETTRDPLRLVVVRLR